MASSLIPQSFLLVNRTWTVHLVRTSDMQELVGDSGLVLGLTDPDRARIYLDIDRHVSQDNLEATYFHEYAHALQFANGQFESPHDEEYTDRLGSFLHQSLRDSAGGWNVRQTETGITARPARGRKT